LNQYYKKYQNDNPVATFFFFNVKEVKVQTVGANKDAQIPIKMNQ